MVWNWHLDVIGEYLMAFRRREINRLLIHVPPRTTKSLSVSVVYPTMVWTTEPWHQFLSVSNEQDLAVRDAVKSKIILESDWYRARWGHLVKPEPGRWSASQYENTARGHRLAEGLHSKITGKGGDTLLIDDPHDSDKVHSDVQRKADLDAYDRKLSTRLNDRATGGIACIMQRQHHMDMSAYLQAKREQAWTVLVLPMEYEGPRYIPINPRAADPRKRAGELLDPSRVTREDVSAMAEDLGHAASGQLQQNPTPPGGGILPRKAWRKWPDNKPLPVPEHVMQVYDTAYTETDYHDASYSARTTWGIFLNENTQRHDIMLMEAWHDRIGYPELRKKAKEDFLEWRPNRVLVEKKASGISLIQDLKRIRRPKLPISSYRPDVDKVARAFAASPLLDAGRVWYPDRQWAEMVIQECSEFPSGAHNDLVDTCVMAWLYLFKGWWLVHPDDEEKRDEKRNAKRRRAPYGG